MYAATHSNSHSSSHTTPDSPSRSTTDHLGTRAHPGNRRAMAFALAGAAAFALFPIVRPWGDKSGSLEEMATAFASPGWVLAHLLGMAGWVLLTAMAISWHPGQVDQVRQGRSRRAAWLLGLGTALVLPYYGAETFALHALGAEAVTTGDTSMVRMEETIRYAPVPVTMFALGLILLGVGVALLARAAASRQRPAAVATAALVALYLPQFFLPAPGRVLHGLLLAAALAWWALEMRRSVRTP